MKTIAFYNNKGGIGKTASVTTVAHMMATKYKKKVLVVDLDPQGNTTSMFSDTDYFELFFRVWEQKDTKDTYSVEDLLLTESMHPHDAIVQTVWEGLDLLPAYMTLYEAEEVLKSRGILTPQHYNLYKQLEKVKEEYDYCLIDCSPSRGLLTSNGLLASDEVYIPTRCDGGSLLGIALTMNFISQARSYKMGDGQLDIGGCFFTQFSGRKNVEKEVYDLIEKIFPEGALLSTTIRPSKLMEEGTFEQKPLLALDPNAKNTITKEYLDLTEYIINRDNNS